MSYFMLKHLLLCKIKVIFIVHLHTKFHFTYKILRGFIIKGISKAFKCEACGACCRHVGAIPELPQTKKKGVCDHLDLTTNKCQIYTGRPLICRVDAMYLHLKPLCTWEEFCMQNKKACKLLREEVFGAKILR